MLALCAGAVMTAGGLPADSVLRLTLASIIGLVIIIGGRIVPALTSAYLQVSGNASVILRLETIEAIASATTTVALGAWTVVPEASFTGYACAVASVAQIARLGQWQGWKTYAWPSVLMLHVAYGWIIVGFALLAVHVLCPEVLPRSPAIYAWTVGAIGSMSLAVMASMIRKHSGHAFTSSGIMTAAYVAITCACVLRLLPELFGILTVQLLAFSAFSWIAAFGLFLAAFWRVLRPSRASAADALSG